MQKIKLPLESFPSIFRQTKKSVIRAGHEAIELGHLRFESNKEFEGDIVYADVNVTGVTHTTINDISNEDATKSGYKSADDFRGTLKIASPNSNLHDLTVINFDLYYTVKGT